jgi:hypothetical protein
MRGWPDPDRRLKRFLGEELYRLLPVPPASITVDLEDQRGHAYTFVQGRRVGPPVVANCSENGYVLFFYSNVVTEIDFKTLLCILAFWIR